MRITARDGVVLAASVIFLVMCSATFLAAAAVAVVAVLRGSDLRHNMALSLASSEWRCRRDSDSVLAACDDCDGSGAKPGTSAAMSVVMAQAKFACLKASFRCSKLSTPSRPRRDNRRSCNTCAGAGALKA